MMSNGTKNKYPIHTTIVIDTPTIMPNTIPTTFKNFFIKPPPIYICTLSNSYLSFCFIASFAFVLQMLRAKPIPLKMNERIQRLPCVKGAVALATEGLFPAILGFFTIPPSAFGCHLPLHKGGFLLTSLYHKSAEKTRVIFRLCRSDIIANAIVILKPYGFSDILFATKLA